MTHRHDDRLKTADTTAVFTAHRAALERLAARITGDREDARDLVADAFAALLEAGPSDPSHAVPWLYLTVRHRAYNRVRERSRAYRRLPRLAAAPDTPTGPESVLRYDARIKALLDAAAAHLSERDRVALLLRHLQQASYDEVAASLGTTPAQARVVVHRATTRLRRQVVTTISHRHRARGTCAGSVAEGGARGGCTGCVGLSDEVIALLQGAIVLPMSRPSRVGNAVRGLWRRAQSATGRAAPYLGEALGSAVAFVAVTTGSVAQAVPAPASNVIEKAAAPAAPAPPRPAIFTGPARASTSAPPAATASVALPAPRATPTVTIGTPLVGHDPGASPGLGQSLGQQGDSLLDILGLPVDLPDPLDAPQGPRVDIRSLEIATLAGRDGRPAAVRWRVAFMAAPPPNVGVGLTWGFENSSCYASLAWPNSEMVGMYCPDRTVAGFDLLYTEVARGRVDVRLVGKVLEMTLRFSELDSVGRGFVHPGARLVRLVATASCYVDYFDRSGCENGDQAPDGQDGYTYRIEE